MITIPSTLTLSISCITCDATDGSSSVWVEQDSIVSLFCADAGPSTLTNEFSDDESDIFEGGLACSVICAKVSGSFVGRLSTVGGVSIEDELISSASFATLGGSILAESSVGSGVEEAAGGGDSDAFALRAFGDMCFFLFPVAIAPALFKTLI